VVSEWTAGTAVQFAGMAEQDAGTTVAHNFHPIHHSGKACSAVERS
jgi:hypothetical protein